MEDFELEEYEDDEYLSQFIDEEEIKKVSKIIEEEEVEDEELKDSEDWFTPDYKSSLEKNRYKSRVDTFKGYDNFTDDIVRKESGGNYKATNPNSSAAGKYQFLWNTWGDEISKFTGVNSKQEFLNNSQAQDKFYNEYYLPEELLPAVKRLKSKGFNMNTDSLAKLVHFRGEKGAYDYLTGKVGDKPEAYNMSISKYIKQTGGYAQSGIKYNNQGQPYIEQEQFKIDNSRGYVPVNPQYTNTQNFNDLELITPKNFNGYDIDSDKMLGDLYNDKIDFKPNISVTNNDNIEKNSNFSNFINDKGTQNAITQAASLVQPALELGRDFKDLASRSISKGTSLANIALNAQESKRKRLQQMEDDNLDLDFYNPNSNNQIKSKSALT